MENQQQKWVVLSFVAFAALVAFVVFSLGMRVGGAYDLETKVRNLELVMRMASLAIGVILFVVLLKNEKTSTFMEEVVAEISKVTWPTQRETASGTVVVMIMVMISGLILWLLDSLWTYVLQMVL